ncbi:MAG: type II secretion system protein [Patescibacteria group bacterium]
MKNKKGFTLIELLVVIAIIGTLSSIVLASLNNARGKGNDAKTKATLNGARAAAEIFFSTNQNYLGLCATALAPFATYLAGASYPGAAAPTCNSTPVTGAAYAMSALLVGEGGTNSWCVDSVGHSNHLNAVLPAATYACPAS